jgi:hypothetical protein
MKTIEKGRDQSGWSKELFCTGSGNGGGGCKAKLLVEEGDLYKTHRYVHVDHDVYITFRCQECGVETDLANSQEPPRTITDKLLDKNKYQRPEPKLVAVASEKTDRERLIEICEKLRLKEAKSEAELDRNSYYVNDQKVVLGSGNGYRGFAVDFTFDTNGKIYSHAIFE